MNETSTKWLQIVDVVDKNGKQNYVTTEYRMPRLYANNILMKQLPKKSSLKRQCPFVRNVRTKPKKCRYYDYSEWLGCAEMSGKNSYYCDAHAKSISILKPAFDLYTKIVRKTSLIRSRAKTKWTGMAFEVNNVKHTGYDAVRYHNEKEGIESYYNINDRKDARQNERLKFEKEYPEAYDPFTKTQEYKKGAFQMRTLFTKRIFNVTFEEALRGRYAFGLLDQPCLFKTPKYSDFYVDNFVNNNIQVSIQRFTQLMFKARCANDYSLFRRYELYLKEILKKKLATKALTYGQCNFLTDNKRKVTCQMKGDTYKRRSRAFIKDLNIYELYKMFFFNRYSLIRHHPRFGRAGRRILTFKCHGKLARIDYLAKKPFKIRPVQIRITRVSNRRR